jgi:short-subunit dehydrogenase
VKPSAIIIGASSGIGLELARLLASRRLRLGLAARRTVLLEQHAAVLPAVSCIRTLDVSDPTAAISALESMFTDLAPVGFIYLVAGTGHLNPDLLWALEEKTIRVNTLGFAALAACSLRLFLHQGHGHLIGISSVAALRGSATAPAYNASKAFASCYLQGLRYRARRSGLPIFVTDVRPGFVDTAMLKATRPFWVASPAMAAKQIVGAVDTRRALVYVTRRWRVIAWLLRCLPDAVFTRVA